MSSLHLTYTLPTLPTTDFYVVVFASSGYTPLCDILDWWTMWDILKPAAGAGKFSGLRDVRLTIKVVSSQRDAWKSREEEMLRGVREMRNGAVGRFVLVLPWEGVECETAWSEGKGRQEVYKGWEIERVVDVGKIVFTGFGMWNMQREVERVWESNNQMSL